MLNVSMNTGMEGILLENGCHGNNEHFLGYEQATDIFLEYHCYSDKNAFFCKSVIVQSHSRTENKELRHS